jgi:mediator of RNA polymerase II transcription subunit 31
MQGEPRTAIDPSREPPARARTRFELELEFVQLLANPHYVAYLAGDGFLADAAFCRYLLYLADTWSQPEYARHVLYPNGLAVLRALAGSEDLRRAAGHPSFAARLAEQSMRAWHHGPDGRG